MWLEIGAAYSPACSTSQARRWHAGGAHAIRKDGSKGPAEEPLFAREALSKRN
jgi:hypothetical protein